MKITRRIAVGVAALLVASLAACGGDTAPSDQMTSSSQDSTSSGDSGSAEGVELTYWMWNKNQEPTFRAMADAFEKQNPNVSVNIELTPVSEYWTKLQTAVQGGAAPDVFWMNHLNVRLYADNGIIAPVDDAISELGIDVSKYPSTIEMYNHDGAQYGLPQDLDTVGMWFNKDLFDAAGLEYPNADWTWDDVEAAAATLTDADAGVYGIASSVDSQSNYYPTIWQAGGHVISEDESTSGWDTAENLAGIQYWVDFVEQGYSPSAAQLAETTADQLFPSGKLAMYYSGTWNVGPYTDDPAIAEMVDVVPLPAGVEEATVLGSLASSVNASSPNLEEATAFALFTASEEAAQIRVDVQDKAPAYNNMWKDWAADSPFDLDGLYEESLETGRRLPATGNTAEWTKIEVDTVTQIFAQQVSPEDGLATIKEGVDKVLAAEK